MESGMFHECRTSDKSGLVRAAHLKRDAALRRIVNARVREDTVAMGELVETYLRSDMGRLSAAARVLSSASSGREIMELADRLDLWRPVEEPFSGKLVPKPDGSSRSVYRFGPIAKAQQLMASDVLRAADQLPDFIHGFSANYGDKSRKGVNAIVAGIRESLREVGGCLNSMYTHCVLERFRS
jgi:hypothetical protein